MDSALELRIAYDNKNLQYSKKAKELLTKSDLVNRLTGTFNKKPLYAIWRIIALSEIPYASTLTYTHQVFEYIEKHLSTKSGFTLSGTETDLLPCYNAMLIEAYSKIGRADVPVVKAAVEWIKKYQPFERNTSLLWNGKGVLKYGGCLKATPCFIGIVKSVKALSAYSEAIGGKDEQIASLIAKGMTYILKHELYKRLSDKEPINNHILDLAFPASYQVNIVELLELADRTGYIKHQGCQSAIEFVNSKKTKEGYWKINHIYKADGYLPFDKRGSKAEWLTYLFRQVSQMTLYCYWFITENLMCHELFVYNRY